MWLDPEESDEDANGVNERWDPGWTLGTCIWALHWHGVWDVESGYLIEPDYFRCLPFDADHLHLSCSSRIFGDRIGGLTQQKIALHTPKPSISSSLTCSLNHLHLTVQITDALGMLRGKYSAMRIGDPVIRQSLRDQLEHLKANTRILTSYPTLIS